MNLNFKTFPSHFKSLNLVFVLVFFSLSKGNLHATDYYVNDGFTTDDMFTTDVGDDSNTGGAGDPFATIQHAINMAADGDHIYVDAGTYFENVIVNKEVEIEGLSQVLTIVITATSDPTGGSLASPVFLVQDNNVLIHHLSIDGKNDLITNVGDVDASTGIITDWPSGDFTNLEVHHVTVQDVYLRGLQAVLNSSATNTFNFHDNIIDGVQGDADNSFGILNWGETGSISNNTITSSSIGIGTNSAFGTIISGNNVTNVASGTGIASSNNGDGGGTGDDITGNTITGGDNGILIYNPYLTVDVESNIISGAINGVALTRDFVPAGGTTNLYRNDINTNVTGVNVDETANLNGATENFIKDNTGDGILISATAGTVGLINDNDLSGNGIYAIENLSGTTISATCNWYGFADEATVSTQISSDVTYSPYLINGTDDDAITGGFQPEANACNGCTDGVENTFTGIFYCTIQSAIDDAATLDGDDLLIPAGTFYENVSVHKELIICGAGQGVTIVKPAISDPTGGSLASAIFKVQASNVVIHHLTTDGKNELITGAGDIDASTGIITDWTFGAGDWDNLEVYNVTVQDVYYRGLQATFNSTPNLFFDFYDNIIDGVQGDPQSIGILNWGDAGIIENNTITNCTNGIVTNESFGTDIFDNNVTGIAGGTCIESDNNGEAGGASLPDYITGNTVTDGENGIVVYLPYLVTDVNENTVSNSTVNGISVIGGPGSVNIYQNAATITGTSIGVDIDGGTAALIENDINTNGTGVRVKGGGILTLAFENFINNNTGDGLLIESDGIVSTGIFDNDLSGNGGFAINNQSTNTIYASCNWYGTKDPEDIAAEISGDVEYVNWLTSGVDDLPAFPGFQAELDACNGNVITNTRNSETFSLIEDAMNDADFVEGDELTVPECVYPGCLTISLDVMIRPLGPVYFDCINMDGAGKNMILGGNLNIFDLTLSNGKIRTNGFNLSCGTINGGGPTNYIVTD